MLEFFPHVKDSLVLGKPTGQVGTQVTLES